MNKYYCDDYVTIYNCDYQDILPSLPKCGLLLTDPPYGLGNRMKGGTWGSSAKYDKMREWDTEAPCIKQLLALNIPSIIWGGNYFTVPPSRCWLSWSKTNVVNTMASMELAWTNFDMPSKEWRGCVGQHIHGRPTEKPLSLMAWCITNADKVKRVETLIDTFAGVCASGRAAKDLGRKCICIEIEEKYCEQGAKRMQQEVLNFG